MNKEFGNSADLPAAPSSLNAASDSRSNTSPVCTVCIANYNGIHFIADCINSVLAQSCDFPIEIIVHDDASTDESVQFIATHYPRVSLITSAENVGFCISNNRMVDAARGKYILLLNNDARLFPDALSVLLNKATSLDKDAVLGLPQYDARSGDLIDVGSRLDLFLNAIPNPALRSDEVAMVVGACLWLPRRLWYELGGFPDWFGSIAEDTLLCCQARLYGYQVIALPASGFHHFVGASLGGGRAQNNKLVTKLSRRIVSERNKNYVIALTYPSPILQIVMPLHLLLLVMEGVTLALIQRNTKVLASIYIASIAALWRNRERLSLERRRIQSNRRIGRREFFSVFQYFPHKLTLLFQYGIPRIR